MKNILGAFLILFSLQTFAQDYQMKLTADAVKYCESEPSFNKDGKSFANRALPEANDYAKLCCDSELDSTLNQEAFRMQKRIELIRAKFADRDVKCRLEKRCDGLKEAQFDYCQVLDAALEKVGRCFKSNGKAAIELCKFSDVKVKEIKRRGGPKSLQQRNEERINRDADMYQN